MITVAAFLIVPGDRIQYQGVDYEVTATTALVVDVQPRVGVTATADGKPYRIGFDQTEFVARHEGSPL